MIARGRCVAKRLSTNARSPMSPCTKTCFASPLSAARFPRLPAYVSLSRLTTGSSQRSRQSRTKFAPMNPAPPVTRIIQAPSSKRLCGPKAFTSRRARILSRALRSPGGIVRAIPVDEARETFGKRGLGGESGRGRDSLDRRESLGDVARLERRVLLDRALSQKALELRDEGFELDGGVVADVVDRVGRARSLRGAWR